jgi:hypothetical protein
MDEYRLRKIPGYRYYRAPRERTLQARQERVKQTSQEAGTLSSAHDPRTVVEPAGSHTIVFILCGQTRSRTIGSICNVPGTNRLHAGQPALTANPHGTCQHAGSNFGNKYTEPKILTGRGAVIAGHQFKRL